MPEVTQPRRALGSEPCCGAPLTPGCRPGGDHRGPAAPTAPFVWRRLREKMVEKDLGVLQKAAYSMSRYRAG